ncbi:MAG: peptidylprolyl isomerase [Candidatus Thermoplasmatota archaeon]|nr:peptidylprolyl isomerase [Candidatus Thermoplasmatota archaeon]
MNDGDFIKVDYEMRVGDEKKLVSTSKEQLAKENDIFDDKHAYHPTVIIVGTDQVFKKINESFKSHSEGGEDEVTMTPDESYGARDPKNIKVHSYIEFKRQNIDPVPGQEVLINHRRGKVLSVTPGRVLVDYNHAYAGKTVYYKYTILEKISDDKGKAQSLISMNYPVNEDKFNVSVEGDVIKIEIPEETKFDPVWVEAKFHLVNDMRKYLPGKTVQLVETYLPQEEPKTEEPATTESAEGNKPEEEQKASETSQPGNTEEKTEEAKNEPVEKDQAQ